MHVDTAEHGLRARLLSHSSVQYWSVKLQLPTNGSPAVERALVAEPKLTVAAAHGSCDARFVLGARDDVELANANPT